mgnify:CR=1 FL=1
MFKTPFLKNWSEYYYIYDELELETKKNSWFQDLDVMTLEECSRAETAVQKIKDKLQNNRL